VFVLVEKCLVYSMQLDYLGGGNVCRGLDLSKETYA